MTEPLTRTDSKIPSVFVTTYYFGCGPCIPKCLQIFAKKKFFTFLLCMFTFLQSSIISGLISTSISTIEKRYNFNSTFSGIIVISYDITVVIGVVLISYFGSKTHRPRLLGVGALLMSIGALLFALPQFLFDSYKYSSNTQLQLEQCLDTRNYTSDCSTGQIGAYGIFIVSNIVMGVGATPLYTLGICYLDEIIYPKYVSLHMGINNAMIVIGLLTGFGVGSAFLSVYVDPWKDTSLTQSNPSWVGAWWIGFVLFAFLLFLLSIIFFMFPRYLSDSYLVQQERAKEMAKIYPSKYANEDKLTVMVKMFPIHIKRLLLNPSFIFMCFGSSISVILVQGIISFAPKYYEVQFRFTASTAGLVTGGIGIPGAIMGTLIGSFLVFICKMKGRGNAMTLAVLTLISAPFSLFFLLHCPGVELAGITAPYADGSQSGIDGSMCAQQCDCESNLFEPVCGADDLNYFSPCRAGCTQIPLQDDESYAFKNCTCIMEGLNTTTGLISGNNITTEIGFCDVSCINVIIPALIVNFMSILITSILTIPFIHFFLRVVADDQRALSLALQSTVFRIIGAIPGPLIFGALFDVSCVSWQTECGRQGNCWLYDNKKLGLSILSLSLPCKIIAFVLFILAFLTFPKKQILVKDEIKDLELKEEREMDRSLKK